MSYNARLSLFARTLFRNCTLASNTSGWPFLVGRWHCRF
jgi:hypothetical protein